MAISGEIDVNTVRDPATSLYGPARADDVYAFHYDETNNIRRLHVTAGQTRLADTPGFGYEVATADRQLNRPVDSAKA